MNKKNRLKLLSFTNFLSLMTLIVSVIVIVLNIGKDKEDLKIKKEDLKIKQEETSQIKLQNTLDSKLKLMTFYLDNYDKFYSKDSSVKKNMALVLETLPKDITDSFYNKIIETTNDKIYKDSYQKVKNSNPAKITSIIKNDSINEQFTFNLHINKPLAKIQYYIEDVSKTIYADENGDADIKVSKYISGKEYTFIIENEKYYRRLINPITIEL